MLAADIPTVETFDWGLSSEIGLPQRQKSAHPLPKMSAPWIPL